MGHQLRGEICPTDGADASLGDTSSIRDREQVVVVEVGMRRHHLLYLVRCAASEIPPQIGIRAGYCAGGDFTWIPASLQAMDTGEPQAPA